MAIQSAPLLHKLLFRKQSASRLWTALGALCIGMTLLLVAVLIWWNFDRLLHGRQKGDSLGSTFLTVSKRMRNENMGNPAKTVFSREETAAFKKVPGVESIGDLLAVKEKVNMSMQLGSGVSFSTLMFLEAVPDPFMDKLPPDWSWQPGKIQVPVILSSEFLSLYNYAFAPRQGLPQLSEESIKILPFKIAVGADGHEDEYVAHIAGFSDRITSVLVPESFAKYVNSRSSDISQPLPSRLVVKVKDPSATAFNDFLKEHDYVTNSEQLRWSKMRAIVQTVAGSTGVLALLLMGVSILVFVLFIELTVTRAQQSIQLLLDLGYKPNVLSRYLFSKLLPLLLGAISVAVLLACIVQAMGAVYGKKLQLSLDYIPGWPFWTVIIICLLLLLLQVRRSVGKAIRKI